MAIEDSTVRETEISRIDICNSSNIMLNLWERTRDALTEKELEWFAGATEHAEQGLISLKQTIENIGCLVMSDANLERGTQAGNFRDNYAASELLFSIAYSLDTIQGLVHIGSSADDRLKYPERYEKSDTTKAVK